MYSKGWPVGGDVGPCVASLLKLTQHARGDIAKGIGRRGSVARCLREMTQIQAAWK